MHVCRIRGNTNRTNNYRLERRGMELFVVCVFQILRGSMYKAVLELSRYVWRVVLNEIYFDYLEICNLFIIQKMNTIVINIIAAFGRMMNVLVS